MSMAQYICGIALWIFLVTLLFSIAQGIDELEETINNETPAEPCKSETKPEPLIECLRAYRDCANKALDEETSRDTKLEGE